MREGSVPAGTDVALQVDTPGIGAVIAWAASALPAGGKWDWADGGLIDRTQFADFMAGVGHAYNGGVDPGANKVRKPDKRGRVPVGADNFGQGAAGRLPNSNRARGQSGGEEQHKLSAAESGVNGSGGTTSSGNHIHELYLNNGAGGGGGAHGINTFNPGEVWVNTGESPSYFGVHSHPLSARIADNAHQNMQPYECDNYIVRVA